jgi:transcriptional regulator with XRE-family HTH domain
MKAQELKTLLGANIKYYRQLKGWTNQELADRAGVYSNTISGYENGLRWPNANALVLLAYVLEVEEWQFFITEETRNIVSMALDTLKETASKQKKLIIK